MALPIDFITRTRALLGEEFDRLEAALSADVPVSIRINPMKGTSAPKAGDPVCLVRERFLFAGTVVFHLRSSIPCGGLLRAGSVFHVSGTSDQGIRERAGTLPGFMRRPGWQVHASGELIAGWKPVSEQ